VLTALQPLLELDAITVTGKPLAAAMAAATGDAVASIDDPVTPAGGLAVLRGNLAPRGALIKVGAADPALLEHRGPAVVFDGMDDMLARIDDEDLPVTRDSVLVLRGVGPKGVPGMPEWGQIPVPRKLLAQGVTDMVRLSDARMSGTAFGTVVLHVAPEAAADGPLRLVRDGDQIALSARDRTLTLDVPDAELDARRAAAPFSPQPARRGYKGLYVEHVLQADQGCDFDFLRHAPGEEPDPGGPIDTGWAGGW
jgi:dihydroxy-acid dehydratase